MNKILIAVAIYMAGCLLVPMWLGFAASMAGAASDGATSASMLAFLIWGIFAPVGIGMCLMKA